MSVTALLLVLASCLLHAGWNLVCKAKAPSAAFFVFASGSSIALMAPVYVYFAPRLGQLPPAIWGFLVATGFFQATYFIGLGNSYRLNDISLAYPVIRALPVLLVPLICAQLNFGAPVTGVAVFGMAAIVCGCLALTGRDSTVAARRQLGWPLGFMLLAAASTTGYSIIDSRGLLLLGGGSAALSPIQASLFYIAFENLAIFGFLLLYLAGSRRERANFRAIRREALRYPLLSGPASTTSYLLVLLAMHFAANVSYIVAFRQVSILLGVVLGVTVLKERLSRAKGLGLGLIFIGLILVALH